MDGENKMVSLAEYGRIARKVMPSILQVLLQQNKLDHNRLDDIDYVWSVVMSNLDLDFCSSP
jgi:hypothetical protein